MKKRSLQIIAPLLLLIPLAAAAMPHMAFAFLGFTSDDLFSITALLSELELAIAGSLVTITGALLNETLTVTLHMSAIVSSTPAIGVAWATIRDFGSMFIIFMLLDASIRIILGVGSDIGKLIKNIVIAGLLINFSLFFTKLAVDASNIVSLSFYSAIAPTGLGQTSGNGVAPTNSAAGSLVGSVATSFDDGGLSNVFMQSLDLQSVANSSPTNPILNGPNKYWNITLANSGGAVLMFFAAISFLAAGVAFAVRIGILILLMAFSPIYFIAMIFPDLKKYSQKWSKMLYAMCIFMPVYLLLMYVAMSVLNDPSFFSFASTAGTPAAGSGTLISPNLIGIVMQYIIAILLINAPLAAAMSIAGEGSDAVEKMMKNVSKWGQGAIQGGQAAVVRNTLGKGAYIAGNSGAMKWASSHAPTLGLWANQGLKNLSGASYGGAKGGYSGKLKADIKAKEEFHKQMGEVDRSKYNSEEEYEAAKKVSKGYQRTYRTNISGMGNMPLWNFLTRDRSSMKAGYNLAEKAKKEELAGKVEENKELAAEQQKIVEGIVGKNVTGSKEDAAALEGLRKENKELDTALTERDRLLKMVKEGSKGSDEKILADLAKKLKEEGGSDEGKKEEKKEEKDH